LLINLIANKITMISFEYIFNENYEVALETLVNFIDKNNLWDIYAKMEYETPYQIPIELFEKLGLKNLDQQTKVQLITDIKFISQLENNEIRKKKFKEYYCSNRLFSHFEDPTTRSMCQNAYNAIVEANGWEYFKNYKPDPANGYMWASDKEIRSLMNKVSDSYPYHSGFSMGFTMRALEKIAETGKV
jgi:hypothetical protein